MKIKKKFLKNIFVQELFGFILSIYITFVRLTSSINFTNQSIPNKFWNSNKPFILAFWHSQLLMISFSWKSKKRINILASSHSDGRFGAIVGKYFKLNNIPTSLDKKSISLKPIFTLLKNSNYLGITPDGPRGPNQKVSVGIIKISKATQVPIIPIGFASSNFRTLKSWDSFIITKPFSKCAFVWGDAITIPKNSSVNQIEEYKSKLEMELNNCIKKAKKEINA